MSNETYICTSCFKEKHLRRYLNDQTDLAHGKCLLCKGTSKAINLSNNSPFLDLIKASIRFYYSETEYRPFRCFNTTATLVELLSQKNHIFNGNPSQRDILTLADQIIDSDHFKDSRVTLYSDVVPYVPAIKDGYWSLFGLFSKWIKAGNTEMAELEATKILRNHAGKCQKAIKPDRLFYRARLGYRTSGHKIDNSLDSVRSVWFPYTDSEISAPPQSKNSNSRFNQLEKPILFLADCEGTAISEIKPYPGDVVSLGQFSCKKTINLIDLTSIRFDDFWFSNECLEAYVMMKDIAYWFSYPTKPPRTTLYDLTQVFAYAFRNLGFEGIAYSSSLCDGTNYAIFDPEHMEYVSSSGACVEIQQLTYSYKSLFSESQKEISAKIEYNLDGDTIGTFGGMNIMLGGEGFDPWEIGRIDSGKDQDKS